MTLRKVPVALALGLLASLAAHTAVFGGDHAMAGGYHAVFLQGTLTAIVGLVVGFAWLVRSGVGTADGSILAARMRERFPSFFFLALAAALWFGLSEMLEPRHGTASPLAIVACLILASWIVLVLARAGVAALARVIIAIATADFSPRTPCWSRLPLLKPTRRRILCGRRLFTRPPPIVTTVRA